MRLEVKKAKHNSGEYIYIQWGGVKWKGGLKLKGTFCRLFKSGLPKKGFFCQKDFLKKLYKVEKNLKKY